MKTNDPAHTDARPANQPAVCPSKTPADSAAVGTRTVMNGDINGANRLFGGRLMEWIDSIAGVAARRHCGQQVTTARVDTLEFKHPALLNDIVVLRARVTYVGRTSLEVRVDSYQENIATGEHTVINTAYLTEVCIDDDGTPVPVPYGLKLESEADRAEYDRALFRREIRKARAESGV